MHKNSKIISPLIESQNIGHKSKENSFDWHTVSEVMLKVDEELAELKHEISSGTPINIKLELGDLLFSLAQLARHLDINADEALVLANTKFEKRFFLMMKLCTDKNLNWNTLNDQEKHHLWEEAKKLSFEK